MEIEKRIQAFMTLAKFTGVEVTSQFLKKTAEHLPQAGIPMIHNLLEGIYKPAKDKYAFCIWSRSAAGKDREVYPDIFSPQADGSWTMFYAAKGGKLDSAANKSLFSSMNDKVPILVIVTSRPQNNPGGSRYKIIGPALVEIFDPASRRFLIRGYSESLYRYIGSYRSPFETALSAMRNGLIMPFQLEEARDQYKVSQDIRDRAFRSIVLEEYRCQCTVCLSKFLLRQTGFQDLIEAEAGHIIPVGSKGPEDPRNGLSFCKRHHWAFDSGLFTITDSKTIRISPSVLIAERRKFDLEEYDGESLVGPATESCRPAEEALHWHQGHTYRRA
jgi:hypothetical protein